MQTPPTSMLVFASLVLSIEWFRFCSLWVCKEFHVSHGSCGAFQCRSRFETIALSLYIALDVTGETVERALNGHVLLHSTQRWPVCIAIQGSSLGRSLKPHAHCGCTGSAQPLWQRSARFFWAPKAGELRAFRCWQCLSHPLCRWDVSPRAAICGDRRRLHHQAEPRPDLIFGVEGRVRMSQRIVHTNRSVDPR